MKKEMHVVFIDLSLTADGVRQTTFIVEHVLKTLNQICLHVPVLALKPTVMKSVCRQENKCHPHTPSPFINWISRKIFRSTGST